MNATTWPEIDHKSWKIKTFRLNGKYPYNKNETVQQTLFASTCANCTFCKSLASTYT